MVAKALFSSNTYEHYTPEMVYRAVGEVDTIGLDPCAAPGSPVVAQEYWTPPGVGTERVGAPYYVKDGLAHSWEGKGLVYWNPPYGRYTCPFLMRDVPRCLKCGDVTKGGCLAFLARQAFGNLDYDPRCDCRLWKRTVRQWVEHAAAQNTLSIGLLPARTDTYFFQKPIFLHALAVCFFEGRFKFTGPKGGKNSAPFPSMAVLFPYGRGHDPTHNAVARGDFCNAFREMGRVWLL
jgi:hypothetical protein